LTTANFKPLAYSLLGLSYSSVTNIVILLILWFVGPFEPWRFASRADNLVS